MESAVILVLLFFSVVLYAFYRLSKPAKKSKYIKEKGILPIEAFLREENEAYNQALAAVRKRIFSYNETAAKLDFPKPKKLRKLQKLGKLDIQKFRTKPKKKK